MNLNELKASLAGVDKVHLNNAGVAPMCAPAFDAAQRTLEKMRDGSVAVPALLADYENARATFAKLVGAEPSDTSFFHTCAAAISQAAFGIPLHEGDEIVVVDEEYPSNAYPWHRAAERAGAVVRTVPVDRILDAINARTKVVATSWVEYATGSSVDLKPIADAVHKHGGWLVVDAIQALGYASFDIAACGADIVVGGTQKWLLGPLGHGFMACAPGRAVQLEPLMVGAMTYGGPDDVVDPKRPARTNHLRFEPGSPLLIGAIAGAAAVEMLLGIGIENVLRAALANAKLVEDGARERGLSLAKRVGPVTTPIRTVIPRKKSANEIVVAMRAHHVSVAPRGGGVRVAPHAHNGPQHIARFFELFDALDR